jgi:DNA polymerase-3 subunit alpha
MSHADFIHLRNHSGYSLLEGALKVKDLVNRTKELGMPAVAITDTGNLFGALEFSETCINEGIQPIIGTQLDVTSFKPTAECEKFGSDRQQVQIGEPDQIVLIAQNKIGYANILKLVSDFHLEPDGNAEPRISIERLEEYSDGIIAFTGASKGGVGRLLAEGQHDAAEELLVKLKKIYGDRLYVEIQRHNLHIEKQIEAPLINLAYKYELPLIATNECFFDTEDIYEAHDALICISAGAYVDQSERKRLTIEHRFKSPSEMRSLFSDLPEAVDNTLVVAKRCSVMAEAREPLLPKAPKEVENGDLSDDDVLRVLSTKGLDIRLDRRFSQDTMDGAAKLQVENSYKERLAYELDVISKMGFSGYFLIVADFIQWSKQNNIPVGPGRGSGAGSVVAWALTITNLDPLRFGLLFERFLNPERISMPDFDIDFCQERRDEVIRYVQGKYGSDRVAQIITFGTLQPRAALRDVGRVLQMPYSQVDRICKLVPNNPAAPVTLQEAIDGEPALQEQITEDARVSRLVEYALRLEGLYRHASTHAAGVVIGDRPLNELVPLYRDPRSDMPVTQFSMKYVELAGLVKFDFLGLKTLTVIAKTLELLKNREIQIQIDTLPFDDGPTFEMLCKGNTTGVFQLESSGMRDILRNMKPDSFEDIIAIVALYRPGPMDNIPSYIRRKHGEEKPDYYYPNLEPILKETYGIMIYQEQVMQIAQELAGYSLGGADLLRRAMGKKIKVEMDAQRKNFFEGAVAKGVPGEKATEVFDQVAKFAGYGFNKSHAAAYALVSYQTAYLKANFPVEFMAASMTLDMQNTDKLNTFKQELEHMGVKLLPPDINKSSVTFSVEVNIEESSVRYALAAIKNVGEVAMEGLVSERKANGDYKNLEDFANRLDTKIVNKRQVEYLIRSGGLDCLNSNRKQLFGGVSSIVGHAGAAQQARESEQIGLFGGADNLAPKIDLHISEDWSESDRLKEEFGAIGFYLSAHPLDSCAKVLERLNVISYAKLEETKISGPIKMAGMVVSKKERISAKGNKYAFVQLSDSSSSYEITVFSDLLAASRDLLEAGNKIIINGSADTKDQLKILANKIKSLDSSIAKINAGLKIYSNDASIMKDIKEILGSEGPGNGEVSLVSILDMKEVTIKLPGRFPASPAMAQALKAISGVEDVREV